MDFSELVKAKPSGKSKSSSDLHGQPGVKGLKIFGDMGAHVTDQHAYCIVASTVKSVISFVKVAYPDLIGGDGLGIAAPLNSKDRKVCRSKLLTCVDRGLHPGSLMQETAYDLDHLAQNFSSHGARDSSERLLCNWDEKMVGKRSSDSKQLQFESRFESGNLRKAIQVNST